MGKQFLSYSIEDRSYTSLIKRDIRLSAKLETFTEKQKAEIDIIVSEITTNVVKHAGSGEILYRISRIEDIPVFEILAIDNGPGVKDLGKMMKDGASTTQTLGQGLGAIERLSTNFNIFSIHQWGTILYSRVSDDKVKVKKKSLDVDVRSFLVNKPRETECGDGYRVKRTSNSVKIFLGDGLGHGQHAHDAVEKAGDAFMESSEEDPIEILRQLHEAARRTRGLVCYVAILDLVKKEWKVCGIGNVLCRVYSGIEYKNYISYNGTVGLNIPSSMRSSVFDAERNQHLFLCSDGIRTRWELVRYPSILRHDGGILAGALYKDFARGTDDAAILIAKVL